MIIKNKFGHTTYGLHTYYWQYRFDKISNYITYDQYLEKRFGKGYYIRKIRKNAIDALEKQILYR